MASGDYVKKDLELVVDSILVFQLSRQLACCASRTLYLRSVAMLHSCQQAVKQLSEVVNKWISEICSPTLYFFNYNERHE